MCKRISYIFFCLLLCCSATAQSTWKHLLPKIEPSDDFSVWSSVNYNSSSMFYNAASVNEVNYMSNNRLSSTIGIDYASYSISYTFRLPFNTLGKNSPLSTSYHLSTGYGKNNWEIDGEISRQQGFYNMTDIPDTDELPEEILNPRYRSDIYNFNIGLTAFYFFNEKFRYSHAMKRSYNQKESGYSFYSSLKQKYHWLQADSTLYSGDMPDLIENAMNDMKRMFIFENSITFGFSGLLTSKHWFVRGLAGFGPGIQLQSYYKNGAMRFRPFISPALDAKFSFGYKARGLHLSVNFPMNLLLVYLPQETFYVKTNFSLSFSIGFHMHDLIQEANERNERMMKYESGSL